MKKTPKEIKAEAKERAAGYMRLKDAHLDKMTKEEFINKHCLNKNVQSEIRSFKSDLDELLRETADKTLKDFMTWFDMQPEHKVMKDSSELIEDYWNSLTSPNTK